MTTNVDIFGVRFDGVSVRMKKNGLLVSSIIFLFCIAGCSSITQNAMEQSGTHPKTSDDKMAVYFYMEPGSFKDVDLYINKQKIGPISNKNHYFLELWPGDYSVHVKGHDSDSDMVALPKIRSYWPWLKQEKFSAGQVYTYVLNKEDKKASGSGLADDPGFARWPNAQYPLGQRLLNKSLASGDELRGLKRYGGGVYFGPYKSQSIPYGRGRVTWTSGHVYEGPFEDGEATKEGRMRYPSGSVYKGAWKNGEQTGWAVMKYAQGGSHSGFYKNGRKHGQGLYYDKDGDLQYQGGYKDGKWSGDGHYFRKDGTLRYTGEYKDGRRSGDGVLFSTRGRVIHAGGFKEGVPHGEGISQKSNGVTTYRNWVRGKVDSVPYSKKALEAAKKSIKVSDANTINNWVSDAEEIVDLLTLAGDRSERNLISKKNNYTKQNKKCHCVFNFCLTGTPSSWSSLHYKEREEKERARDRKKAKLKEVCYDWSRNGKKDWKTYEADLKKEITQIESELGWAKKQLEKKRRDKEAKRQELIRTADKRAKEIQRAQIRKKEAWLEEKRQSCQKPRSKDLCSCSAFYPPVKRTSCER